MATAPDDKMISVREAAQQCGRNPETVRRWIWSGKLPAEKLGNQLFVRRSNLESFCSEIDSAQRQMQETLETLEFNHSSTNSGDPTGLHGRIDQTDRVTSGESREEPDTLKTQLVLESRTTVIEKLRTFREEIRSRSGNLDLDETMEQLKGNE